MLLIAVGLAFALLSLVLAATVVASGGLAERTGRLVAFALFLLVPAGLYLTSAGAWGGWSPGPNIRQRVRSIRVLLIWALLVGGYICYGLPLLGAMTATEWSNFIVLASLLLIAVFASIAIGRRNRRAAVVALGAAGLYAVFMTLRVAMALLLSPATLLSGPARALSFVLVASFGLAILAASILALPLWSRTEPTAN